MRTARSALSERSSEAFPLTAQAARRFLSGRRSPRNQGVQRRKKKKNRQDRAPEVETRKSERLDEVARKDGRHETACRRRHREEGEGARTEFRPHDVANEPLRDGVDEQKSEAHRQAGGEKRGESHAVDGQQKRFDAGKERAGDGERKRPPRSLVVQPTSRLDGQKGGKEGDGREHQSDFKRRSAVAQSVESHGETHARRTAVQYEQNEENFCQRRVHGNPPASARNVTDAQKSKNEVVTDA